MKRKSRFYSHLQMMPAAGRHFLSTGVQMLDIIRTLKFHFLPLYSFYLFILFIFCVCTLNSKLKPAAG